MQQKTRIRPFGLLRLALLGFAGASLLAFAFFFRSSDEYYINLTLVLIFGAGPIVFAAFCLCAMAFQKPWRAVIVLTLFTTLTAVYAAEIFLWMTQANKSDAQAAAELRGQSFDSRTMVEVVAEMRRQGIRAYPAVLPNKILRRVNHKNSTNAHRQKAGLPVYESRIVVNGRTTLPLGGISNTTTVLCNEAGRYETYVSDEHGFNNPKGLWSKAPLDVVVIGNSIVHNYCLPRDKGLVATIRRKHPKTLGLGMGGNGPLLELAVLKEYLPELRPRTVVWVFWAGNDLSGIRKEMGSGILRQYLKGNFKQNLRLRQRAIDHAQKSLVDYTLLPKATEEFHRSKAFKEPLAAIFEARLKLRQVRQSLKLFPWFFKHEFTKIYSGRRQFEITLLNRVLVEAKRVVEGWGGQMVFIHMPSAANYYDIDYNRHKRLEVHRLVLQAAENAGIHIVDINATFDVEAQPKALYNHYKGHPTEYGYRLAGKAILEVISKQKVN